jgi:glycosyltransferase, MGT family
MCSEAGHYTGTFRLARELRSRGFKVVYLTVEDLEPLVTAQGFSSIIFAPQVLSAGYAGKLAASHLAGKSGILGAIEKRRRDEKFFSEYLSLINDGHLDDCIRSVAPDVVLCDTLMWYVAFRATRLEIPVVSISTILTLFENDRIPPVICDLAPRNSTFGRLEVLMTWRLMRMKFFFTKRLASLFNGAFRAPTRMHHLMDVFFEAGRLAGYPLIENQTYWYGEIGPRLRLPEIVLCPRSFQLDGAPMDGRKYLGEFVDLERREISIPPGAIDENKPLIYCSLGSSATFYPHSKRFFQAIMDAAKLRPEWQFVVHLGNYTNCFDVPANVYANNRVPQLALLRRAAVMVTHAGANSVMECIANQVPMVVCPGMRDQPGNATRAVVNGLAVREEMAKITAESIIDKIDYARNAETLRENLALMSGKIDEERGMEQCIELIARECERKLASREAQLARRSLELEDERRFALEEQLSGVR